MDSMRLLVLNSNTSPHVTDMVAASARRYASSGTMIDVVTGTFGPRVITSRAENTIAAHATLDLLAANLADHDGALIAVSYDSGLRAARELFDIPILGITEAALLAAMTLGTRIGLIMFGSGSLGVYREVISAYGLDARICGYRRIDTEAPYIGGDQTSIDEAIVALVGDLATADEADVVILLGAVMGGRSADVEDRTPVPVLDGVRCGLPMLEAMARIRPRAPVAGSYSFPASRPSVDLSPRLAEALFKGRAERDQTQGNLTR